MPWGVYSLRLLDSRIDTDAEYRVLGKWYSDRLQDLGWAKTADTGQIDWSSATRPGTTNTKGGYEIRKSTVSSADIYLKISYGQGFSTNSIGLWLQTGDGSDGAGVLTGDVTTEQQPGSAHGTATPYESSFYVAGDGSNFVLACSDITAANGFVGGVQRTCDASGVDTATGYYLYRSGYGGTAKSTCQYCSFASGVASQDDIPGFGSMYLPRQIVSTSCLPCLPLYAQNGLVWSPMRDICSQEVGTVSGEFDVPLLGSTRRFKVVLATTNASVWGYSAVVNQGIGFRVS